MIAMRRGMTERVVEVLDMTRRGLTQPDIAHQLGVSVATVKLDLIAAREFFGVETTVQAVACWAVQQEKGREGRRTRRKPGAPSLELFG